MMDFQFNADGDEDNEFESSESLYWTGRDGTVFIIDAASEMFSADDGEECPFSKALRCTHAAVSRKVIGSSQDMYAVIFFNTSQAKNDLEFPNIHVLHDFDRPGAERMLELEMLLGDDMKSIVNKKFGSSNSVSMHDLFWVCRNIFIKCKTNLSSKNVLIFTCTDDPHGSNDHKKKLAVKSAKDLKEIGAELELLPLRPNFDLNKFYKSFLIPEEEQDSGDLPLVGNSSERIDELLERVRRLEHRQRSTGKVSFTIAKGLEIGVKLYTTYSKVFKPRVKLFKVTNEEVTSQRKEFHEETGGLVMPSDFQKYQIFGGKKLKFSVDEVKFISMVYEPGIELLGFKPKDIFKPFLYIKPSSFIYPDETFVKGGTTLFTCLLERCVQRNVYPIARVIARQGSAVAWAFLLPQEEETDENGYQIKPPGFHICYLPFADDIRLIDVTNRTRASHDQVDAAKNVIKKLHFKYSPDAFENPEIQTHWRNIETLALNRLELEAVTDYTVPNYQSISKKAGGLIDEFKELVLSPDYDPTKLPKKRPTTTATENKNKRMKTDQPVNVEEMARRKEVVKLKVDELKEWLQARGVRTTGKKKAQLVDDVYEELQIEV